MYERLTADLGSKNRWPAPPTETLADGSTKTTYDNGDIVIVDAMETKQTKIEPCGREYTMYADGSWVDK